MLETCQPTAGRPVITTNDSTIEKYFTDRFTAIVHTPSKACYSLYRYLQCMYWDQIVGRD
jgi:hypothetical protein